MPSCMGVSLSGKGLLEQWNSHQGEIQHLFQSIEHERYSMHCPWTCSPTYDTNLAQAIHRSTFAIEIPEEMIR